MPLIKDVILITTAFSTGYFIGSSPQSSTKKIIESYKDRVKFAYDELKELIFSTMENNEGLDSKELKKSLTKTLDFIQEKFEEAMKKTDASKVEKKFTTKKTNTKKVSIKNVKK